MAEPKFLASLVIVAAAVGGSACAVDAPLDAPSESLGAQLTSTRRTTPRVLSNVARSAVSVAAPSSDAVPHLVNHGGPVLSNVKVVSVLWGPNVDATIRSSLGAFYSSVLASPYLDWLREYDTPTQSIGRGTFQGMWTITPTSASTIITQTLLENELVAKIDNGTLPAPDANTLYVVHLPPGIKALYDNMLSGGVNTFCGYHDSADVVGSKGTRHIRYALIVDFGAGSGCENNGSDPVSFNNVTLATSHEMVEAITDPDPQTNSAWWDETFGEIGDVCAWQPETIFIKGQPRIVQKEWSNSAGACVATNPFGWNRLPGCASEIAAGPNGLAFVLGCDLSANYDYSVWAWSGLGWYQIDGRATRIAASPEGTPWIVTSTGAIQKFDSVSRTFRTIGAGGCARSIGVGANDAAWVTGCGGAPGSYDDYIFQLVGGPNGHWHQVDGAAWQVATTPRGRPWAVTKDGAIYQWSFDTSSFQPVATRGCGTWVAPSEADTWLIGCGMGEGVYLYRSWFPGWDRVNGVARRVAVQVDGTPWVLGNDGSIFTPIRSF